MARGYKTGGRQKGTSNKVTQDVRQALSDIFNDELGNVRSYLSEVEPKERLNFMIKLLPYILPRYESVSYNDEDEIQKTESGFSKYVDDMVKQISPSINKTIEQLKKAPKVNSL